MAEKNYFNNFGYLTEEERKKPLTHQGRFFRFETCYDLSNPIKVTPKVTSDNIQEYSNDLSDFISWWTNFIWKDLNGFNGFGYKKFEF